MDNSKKRKLLIGAGDKMGRIFIFFVLLLSVLSELNAAHVDSGKSKNILLKESSSSRAVGEFYRSLGGSLNIRLIYCFNIISAKKYEDVSDLVIDAKSCRQENAVRSQYNPLNQISCRIVQMLREEKACASYISEPELNIDSQKAMLADFDSLNDEYRALFDMHIKIKYAPITQNYLKNIQRCLSELKLERHLTAFINYNHEFKSFQKKFISFNKKYYLIINLLATNNSKIYMNDDNYIYFLDEICNLQELIINFNAKSMQLFSNIAQDDWLRIAGWEKRNKKIRPELFLFFKTHPDFLCCVDS